MQGAALDANEARPKFLQHELQDAQNRREGAVAVDVDEEYGVRVGADDAFFSLFDGAAVHRIHNASGTLCVVVRRPLCVMRRWHERAQIGGGVGL